MIRINQRWTKKIAAIGQPLAKMRRHLTRDAVRTKPRHYGTTAIVLIVSLVYDFMRDRGHRPARKHDRQRRHRLRNGKALHALLAFRSR